jgi:hypothetical protein
VSAVVQTLAWVGAAWMAAAVYVAVAKPFRDEPKPRPVPAAPDNQPGHDDIALATCRRIARIPAQTRKENP